MAEIRPLSMRTITVSQGVDPREFTLVAFGGAGPMAAAFLAQELDIKEVLVPKFPGTFSAWGMLQTDLRHDFTQSFFRPAGSVNIEDLNDVYEKLEAESLSAIMAEGIEETKVTFYRSGDMRYQGQEYSINVPVTGADIGPIADEFHAAHNRRYGHSSPGAPIEFVNLRLAAFGGLHKYSHASATDSAASDPVIGEREIVFDGTTHATPIVARERLATSYTASGPLIIEEKSATTVVPPDWNVVVDQQGSIILRQENS